MTGALALARATTAAQPFRYDRARALGKGTIFPIIHFSVEDATHDSGRVHGGADLQIARWGTASIIGISTSMTWARSSQSWLGEHLSTAGGAHLVTPDAAIQTTSGKLLRHRRWCANNKNLAGAIAGQWHYSCL
jgi:hypothetical protein